MIVYDLSCSSGHRFEGWFGSSEDFAAQRERGLVSCPQCGSGEVDRAPMAPAVGRKSNQQPAVRPASEAPPPRTPVKVGPLPPEMLTAMKKLAEAQHKALANSTWVGDAFAERSRAIHYGESEAETIHGHATPEEAQELVEEGIPVSPLPFPVAPPDDLN